MVLCQFVTSLDRRFSVRSEVVVERHFARSDVVLFPLRRPFGECKLRRNDFLKERVRRDIFLGDLVVELELLAGAP